MSEEELASPACRVCGRNLLPGERPVEMVSATGEPATVCPLCKPRAEVAGWMRSDQAAAMRERGVAHERRRGRPKLLSGVLGRGRSRPGRATSERSRGGESGAVAPPRESRAARRPEAESRAAAGPRGINSTLGQALDAFNASQHRRTVRGLTRSLGEPRASGLAIRTEGGATGARLTVVWELAWYQWEVAPGKRGFEVRESGKGETVDQLRAADRTWNLAAAADGTLSVGVSEPIDQ